MSKFRSFFVLLVSACAMFALAACKPQPSAPAVTAPAVVDGSADTAVGDADVRIASVTQFHARGNEPFWSVKVDGTALVWTTPEMQPGKPLVAERSVDAKDVSFIGHDGDMVFVLDISHTPCQDSMSGEMFEFTATFTYDGEKMTGCASSGL